MSVNRIIPFITMCPKPRKKQSNDKNEHVSQGLAKGIKIGADNNKEMTTVLVQLEGQGKNRRAAQPMTNAVIREYRA